MNIIFYSKTGCPWGDEVRDFLNLKNIPFTEKEMLLNPDFMKECIEKTGQSKCPTLDIGGFMLPDSDANELQEYLERQILN